jgi:hypothetical protein
MPRIRRPLPAPSASGHRPEPVPFFSADDFDATCILVGFDPSASSYWWLPELLAGPAAMVGAAGGDATAVDDPARDDLVVGNSRRGDRAQADRSQAARTPRTSSPAAA